MHYEVVKAKLFTWKTAILMLLMAGGALAFLARFALGLGATTHLSNNYPWGLWIVFDLIWIALAGGAFVTAGIVYIFMAEQFHVLGRPAVWMGFLSYNCVVVTLLGDLGLPWHFWQLGVQMPEHSAMYEVSWCVTLYVTVLGLEFVPAFIDRFEKFWPPQSELWARLRLEFNTSVLNRFEKFSPAAGGALKRLWSGSISMVFDRLGWAKIRDLWKTLSPIYTVIALGLFVFLMSHQWWMALLALVLFAVVVYLTRDSYQRFGVPVILVVAAVTFSAMHQSSLGSLFLLMPDKLSHLWWSPIMSILFFLSAVASGMALVMVMDLLISYFFDRPYHWKMLGRMGKILGGALGVYYAIRIADVIARGEIGLAFAGTDGVRFLIEIIAGGLIPIAILSLASLRNQNKILVLATLLAIFGVIFNRLNVVLLGMRLPGTMPGGPVPVYYPSLVEWMLAISLVSGAVFFFALGLKLMPILPKAEESH